MRRLVMWNLMTLDGFIEGPNRDIGWHEQVWGEELENYSKAIGRVAGGFVFGRVTYELMADYWPSAKGEIADFMNSLPKFVFSRTLKSADWNNSMLISSDAPDAVGRLKEQAGGDLFLFGSAGLAQTLIDHGLIDEYRIGVSPFVLGGGTPLFRARAERIHLKHIDSTTLTSGVVILRYVPHGET